MVQIIILEPEEILHIVVIAVNCLPEMDLIGKTESTPF